jgi:aconitate hydratase
VGGLCFTSGMDTGSTLSTASGSYRVYRLDALEPEFEIGRLPYTLRILLENLLRTGDEQGVRAVAGWDPRAEPSHEVTFSPSRVLLQDFTGVPAVVDLAAIRDAVAELGGDPGAVEPRIPAELVIDHSVQVDEYASRLAFAHNVEFELERNRERYSFLRWGQDAFGALKVVPPGTGICHQVNLEYLARVVETRDGAAFPDTLIGTDSHTTMVNGLGVLGWGVGGIEAEAAMLGEPLSMLVPQVVGVFLHGALREGVTATDLVLTVTELLRSTGVVGKFVEYSGEGLAALSVADRATLANMSPEYGATCGFFPVDEATLAYLRLTGRPEAQVELVEAYCKQNLLWHDPSAAPAYSQRVELDLDGVEPSLAGPRRPQDRVPLRRVRESFLAALASFDVGQDRNGALAETFPASDPTTEQAPAGHRVPEAAEPSSASPAPAHRAARLSLDGEEVELGDGTIVIAAITSCTNTSNPQVMVAAGLLAKKAVELGLRRAPWVKTSLAPGSRVVSDYLAAAGLQPYLDELGFDTVGYGCTTCIGNSGPLRPEVSAALAGGDLVTCAVLSGNRNFEARIHPDVKANYLASPPLVVAYALAGRIDLDLQDDPLGQTPEGDDIHLADLWPSSAEIQETIARSLRAEMFERSYSDVFTGDEAWRELPSGGGQLYDWDARSTYIRRPTYLEGLSATAGAVEDVLGARCLVSLGDSVTTDHISPAGAIRLDSPAGRYLVHHGVDQRDFNSYGSRRGNHELMMRGTFANLRLRNLLVPDSEGNWTVHFPSGERVTIFEASERYLAEGTPLVVLAGKEYGSGSSRDWAAKGPALLGVRAVLAESYERIHRSNLLMMGILPLQFVPGESRESLGLSGREEFSIRGLAGGEAREVRVHAGAGEFAALLRLDTPREREYFRQGGILPFVVRRLLAGDASKLPAEKPARPVR